ncbi:hypothetical protein GALL_504690 [mine drainage metagenome]|uniref:Uncharacterized protein n=1 Tax=mine drainage metagenome TaxID=410659 RepID=A0A1J5PK62_9ZZZZ
MGLREGDIQQIHAHHVPADAEEDAVPEAQHSGHSPDEVESQCEQGEAHDLSDQIDAEQRQGKDASRREQVVGNRHVDRQHDNQRRKSEFDFLLKTFLHQHDLSRSIDSASAARLHREEPVGALLDDQDDDEQHGDLGCNRPVEGLDELVDLTKRQR